MMKPVISPPPIPKPRPPPKPDIHHKSTAKICPATGKPVLPPRPTTKANVAFSEIKSDEVPKRPFKPVHLSSQSEKTIPGEEIHDQQDDDLYDDVNVQSTTDDLCGQPQLSKKTSSSSCSLAVRPTPSPRLSPHASPLSSPRGSPLQVSATSLLKENDKVLPSPRPRTTALKDKEGTTREVTWKKPEIPPKPIYLHNIYHNRKVTGITTQKKGAINQDQSIIAHHGPATTKQDNQSKPNSIPISPAYGSNNSKEAVKKRIASRRQLNPKDVKRTLPADVKSRRPPPPPPTNLEGSKKSPMKGPAVFKNLDREDKRNTETFPKTAEDQSLYSYAYEHTGVSMPNNCPHPQGIQSEDNSYVEPGASVVNSFMEELRNKDPVSSEQYEISAEDGQEDNSYVEPGASVVNSFMEELRNKGPVSSEQYEISAEDGQEDNSYVEPGASVVNSLMEELRNKDPVSSGQYEISAEDGQEDNSYVEPGASVVNSLMEELSSGQYEISVEDGQGFSAESSNLEEYHEYEYPDDSHPPVPPHRRINNHGSYDIASFENDMLKENEDDDNDGEYPTDLQGSSEEDSDEDAFWGDDDESVEEPLYQIYTARTLQKDRTLSRKRTNSNQQTETFIEDLTKGTLRNMRMLWCEMPDVVVSGILDNIDSEERKRQEAMFEVITSEASYLKSINILESHFIDSPELTPGTPQSVIGKAQHHILFSNVRRVSETSQRFLEALRKRQKESLVISSISDIIEEFATKHFEVYVKYCSNQLHQDRVLKELSKHPRYVEGIQRLEKSSTAQCLSMHSFLVLPMQRITRLPLLVDAICHRCEPGSDEFVKTDAALKAVNKIVRNCNEGARKMERMEEMLQLQPQIEFTIKPIALVTANRWLLRRGEIVLVIEQSKHPLSKKKPKLKPVYMFLFNDFLLIAKKKGEQRYRVLDYAARHMTKVEESTDSTIQLDHMLSLILLENSNGKTKDFILCAESQTDKTRWLEAFNPPEAEQEGEKVYGAWDCPQVQVIHNYGPQQPDELALHEGDVINVQRKLPDGWFYGERLCDGVCGWFPANYTENIRNEHVRARNLLQRYRLLAASKHLFGAAQTMKAPKTSKISKAVIKRDTIS